MGELPKDSTSPCPLLSKQIAQLEEKLGFTLFLRNSKGV